MDEKRFDPQAEGTARIAFEALFKPELRRTLTERRALDTVLGNTRAAETEAVTAATK